MIIFNKGEIFPRANSGYEYKILHRVGEVVLMVGKYEHPTFQWMKVYAYYFSYLISETLTNHVDLPT